MKKNSGFSLLEVLIAVTILTSMSLIMYSVMGRTLKSKEKVERQDDLMHSVSIAMSKMVADLSQAFVVNVRLKGDQSAYDTGMKGSEDKLDFSTMSHFHYIKDAKDTDQVSVGYSLKKNENGLYDLVRRESSRLSKKIDEGGASYVLIENVKELHFHYYDSSKEEWLSEVDSSSLSWQGRLPEAVRIEFEVMDVLEGEDSEKGRMFSFSTMVSVDTYNNEINF